VRSLSPFAEETTCRRIFRHRIRRRRLDAALQHRANSASTDHPAESEGTSTGIVAGALGFDPLVGEGHVRRSHDDQRQIETAATKPAFRDPLTYRRCLIPADGFYEWQRRGKAKQPFCFEVNYGELFAFAGLWDRWKDPSGQWLKSCSILTTTPNAVTSAVHDRMPVILDPDNYDLWLDPGMTNVEAVSEMLKPSDARLMRCYPVSTRINYVANDDAECSAPVELAETQAGLFS